MKRFIIRRSSRAEGTEYYIGPLDRYAESWAYTQESATWFMEYSDAHTILSDVDIYGYTYTILEIKVQYATEV